LHALRRWEKDIQDVHHSNVSKEKRSVKPLMLKWENNIKRS
jgi:hypothetical protein